jgi:hypothetical protein
MQLLAFNRKHWMLRLSWLHPADFRTAADWISAMVVG